MQENTDQNNSKYGHFSRSIWKAKSMVIMKFKILYLNTKITDRMSHDFTFLTQKRWFRVPKLVSDISLALYEDKKYLKCNPNFTSEISVDKLRVLPAIYR